MRDGLSQEPGQVNPSLLIERARVLGIELARGNVLKVRGQGRPGRAALAVTDLTIDPDGCPVLHVSPATAEQVTAREDEARRVGGPVVPDGLEGVSTSPPGDGRSADLSAFGVLLGQLEDIQARDYPDRPRPPCRHGQAEDE